MVAAHHVIPSFEEHRKIGLGKFLTRDDLAKHQGRLMADVLSQVTSLSLIKGVANYAWVYSMRVPPSLQGTGVYSPERYELLQGMKAGCYARVYVDNVLMNPGTPAEPFNVNTLSANLIEAVEWYAGPSQTPHKYNHVDSACGVLVIWSRR
jgi:hypothetical protein